MKQTTFEEFVELARRGTFVPVVKEIIADLLTPVSAFLKIAEHSDYAFLFESVEGGEQVARYSFLGKDPFLVLRAERHGTSIERSGTATESEAAFIPTLRRLMAELRSPFVPGLPRFTGGAVGFIGYDASPMFEPVLKAAWQQARRSIAPRDAQRRRCRVHALRHGARLRSRQAPHPDHRQRAHHRRRRPAGALPVRMRQNPVPRARAGARAVAAGAGSAGRHRRSARTRPARRSRRACARSRSASPRATSTRRCCRSASRPTSPPILSPSIARCGTSTRRRTCISSAWARSPSSARRRRCSCGSKGAARRRIRLPARGRAARTTMKICGWRRS